MYYKIFRWIVLRTGFPCAELLGKIFPGKRDVLERLIIKWNNKCVQHFRIKDAPTVLVLIPHCLQNDDCVFRITRDIGNCKKCGKCIIKDLSVAQDKLKIPIKVAAGGTLARKIVMEYHPDIIVACACERDLSSGIYDSYPLPVWGILNLRPNGPCYNTDVDISLIESAVFRWVGKK
ncbi:MAG: DUF116 domain-containing protein [Elusimicrobiota bacterium]